MKEKSEQAKSFAITLVFAISILILVISVINVSKYNIVGKAFYTPIKVYGTVSPELLDGTEMIFKVNNLEIAATLLKDSKYGYEPEIVFQMDNPSTPQKEGYAQGDTVQVYFEEVETIEYVYFTEGGNQKDINIPVSKREDIANRAAQAILLCEPIWGCTGWSNCIDSAQTKVCIDKNDCRFQPGKPDESRKCSIPPKYEQPKAIEQESLLPYLFLALVIIFIVGGMIIYKFKKH